MSPLAQMGEIGYNTRVNHIKSDGLLAQHRHHYSTDVRGIDTMSHSTPGAPALKVCVNCKQAKPLNEFSNNRNSKDGLNSYCKPCASVRYKVWREANQARRNEYMREWHQVNLEHETRYARERYRNDEEYRRKVLEWAREYRQRHPQVQERHWLRKKAIGFRNDMTRAHTVVSRAVRRGVLPPAWSMVCEGCQEAQASHWHHHKGYARQYWLDVVPLCFDCHGKEHRQYE